MGLKAEIRCFIQTALSLHGLPSSHGSSKLQNLVPQIFADKAKMLLIAPGGRFQKSQLSHYHSCKDANHVHSRIMTNHWLALVIIAYSELPCGWRKSLSYI